MTSNLTESEKREKFARFFVLFCLYLVKRDSPLLSTLNPIRGYTLTLSDQKVFII